MRRPPVVVLSGVRWDFLWQRHQAVAAAFVRAGYPTVFVETTGLANPRPDAATIRKVAARLRRTRQRSGSRPGAGEKGPQDGPVVYAPLALPPTLPVFRALNRRYLVPRISRDLRELCGERPVVVAYPPTRTTLDLVSALDPRLLVYDRADDYRYFPRVPHDVAATERELLMRADLISCTSSPLLEDARRLRPDAFPSGPAVDYELFAPLQDPAPSVPPRTVGFFGDAGHGRLDFDALRAVLRAGFRVRLVGETDRADRSFFRESGVEVVGAVPHAGLPRALAGVDAFMLPYKTSGLTRAISPAKIHECLATGRPVVAPPLPALAELSGHVYLATEPEDYPEVLRNLAETETPQRVLDRTRLARENSWEARFGDLERRIRRALGAGS